MVAKRVWNNSTADRNTFLLDWLRSQRYTKTMLYERVITSNAECYELQHKHKDSIKHNLMPTNQPFAIYSALCKSGNWNGYSEM